MPTLNTESASAQAVRFRMELMDHLQGKGYLQLFNVRTQVDEFWHSRQNSFYSPQVPENGNYYVFVRDENGHMQTIELAENAITVQFATMPEDQQSNMPITTSIAFVNAEKTKIVTWNKKQDVYDLIPQAVTKDRALIPLPVP